MNEENLISYNQLQYDRIDKLETKRENFCNYVITLTSAIYTIGFIFLEKIQFAYAFVLICFIIILNLTAIIFNWRTRPWIKLHQERAKLVRAKMSTDFEKLEDDAKKNIKEKYIKKKSWFNFYQKATYRLKSDGDPFRRSRVYSAVHWIIILFSIYSLFCINEIPNDNKSLKIEFNLN